MEEDSEKTPLKNTVEIGVENFDVDCEKIYHILEVIAKSYKVESYPTTVSFIPQSEMVELNKEYRDKHRSTDVLSFPQIEWQEPLTIEKLTNNQANQYLRDDDGFRSPVAMLGDIVISLEDAENNAKNIGQGLDRELCFLIVHGFLHLVGHDHIEKQDEVVMRKEQDLLMEILEPKTVPLWKNCVRRSVGSD